MGEVVEVGLDSKHALDRSQTAKLPRRHCSHSPQMIVNGMTTRSPTFNLDMRLVGVRNPDILRLSAGVAAREMGVSKEARGRVAEHFVGDVFVPVVPANGLSDEQVLFLGDIFPTGWQAAVQCDIQPTDTVAIWGCGPVGQMTIRSAILLGAKQVLAIDNVPERLAMAQAGGATTLNFDEESVVERLNDLTDGKGPEKCIDAVGMEAHAGGSLDAVYDKVKQTLMLETTGRMLSAR